MAWQPAAGDSSITEATPRPASVHQTARWVNSPPNAHPANDTPGPSRMHLSTSEHDSKTHSARLDTKSAGQCSLLLVEVNWSVCPLRQESGRSCEPECHKEHGGVPRAGDSSVTSAATTSLFVFPLASSLRVQQNTPANTPTSAPPRALPQPRAPLPWRHTTGRHLPQQSSQAASRAVTS